MQHCTLIRAKREALTKAPAYVSVRHTDNDKSASIFIIVVQALVAPLRPSTKFGQGLPPLETARGHYDCPSKKRVQHCTASHAPKGGQNGRCCVGTFFTPVVLDYLNVSKFRFISETISCFISFIVFSEIWYSDVLWNLSLLGRNNVYASTPSASAIFSANLRDGHLRPISI